MNIINEMITKGLCEMRLREPFPGELIEDLAAGVGVGWGDRHLLHDAGATNIQNAFLETLCLNWDSTLSQFECSHLL